MKKIMGLTLSAAVSLTGFAQKQNEHKQSSDSDKFEAVKGVSDSSKIYTSVEQFPEFEGGQKGLSSFLGNNIQYPADARAKEIQGRVVVKFVVCTDGSLCDETIVHSVDSSIDNEVLRVVKSMPKWKPGMQNGEPVKTFYLLPVTFKLQGQEKDTLPDAREYLMTKAPQSVEPDQNPKGTLIKQVPEFPGGRVALAKFIKHNMKYPNQAREDNIQGNVYVEFMVEADGTLSDIHYKRPLGGGCEEEAVRIVKLMPKWSPGKEDGKPTKMSYVLPLAFRLWN